MSASTEDLVWQSFFNKITPKARALKQYERDPVAWVHDCIRWPEGQAPADYQEECLSDLVEHGRLALRGPHGIGKGFIGAMALLWFASVFDGFEDWKVPTTAGSWGQLSNYFWPEVHKWTRLLDYDRVPALPQFRPNRELLDLAIKGKTGRAFAMASKYDEGVGSKAEGAHAEYVLSLIDEAKMVPDGTWDSSEGYLSIGTFLLALAMSTPGAPSGRFYRIFQQRHVFSDWKVRHITAEETIAAGRMSREWYEARARQWGENSSLFRNRAQGEFASGEDDCVPLAWVEAAQERWRNLRDLGALEREPLTCISADIADSGEDRTCIGRRHGDVIADLQFGVGQLRDANNQPDYGTESVAAAGRIKNLLGNYGGKAVVDANTFGATVVGLVREDFGASRVLPYNGSVSTNWRPDRADELKFKNVRSAAYWNLREAMAPLSGRRVALPDLDELTEDLTTPKWMPVDSQGRQRLEDKDEVKKRLGRSPDAGDMVAMAFWYEQLHAGPGRAGFSVAMESSL